MIGWMLAAALAVTTPGVDAAPPPLEEVMAVPAELQALVRDQVVNQARAQPQRLQRLVLLMSSPESGLGMQYRDDATLTVRQAFETRQANCVTYTMMFMALARIAGLQAYPQEIDETLAWQQRGNIVYRSNHVNALVRIGSRRMVIDVGSSFVIGRHPAHAISERRLLAQYYNNRAAQLMEQRQLPLALAYADVALGLDAAYANTWSNTGVLRLHSGDRAGAQSAYLKALELDANHSGALFNLVNLYRRSDDAALAAQYQRRLEKLQSTDPFYEVMLAVELENRGDGRQAAEHYQRAIHLHPGEHRFYFGLARASVQAGDPRRAQRALQRAIALSKDPQTRSEYQSLLAQLQTSGRLTP